MNRRERHLVVWALYVSLTLTVGTTFYDHVEGMSKLDACYFSVITITSIGYGDFVPHTDIGKMFTAFYALSGQALFVTLLAIMHRRRADEDERIKKKFLDEKESSKVDARRPELL